MSQHSITDVEATALSLLREIALDTPADLSRQTDVKAAGISSLDLVEMIFALEERYDIEIPYNANADDGHFNTLGDMIGVVEKLVAQKPTADTNGPIAASEAS